MGTESIRRRKGELVAVQKIRTYFQSDVGVKTYDSWSIGCVWKTNRAGQITHVFTSPTPPKSQPSHYDAVEQYDKVLMIPEDYEQAARFLGVRSTTREWFPVFKSQETLAEAVKDVQARLERGELQDAA